MSLALGQRLLFHQLGRGSWIGIVAVIAVVLLLRFWPLIVSRIEDRRRSR